MRRPSPELILLGYLLFVLFAVLAQTIGGQELQIASIIATTAACFAILYLIPAIGWISFGGLFVLWTAIGVILKWCIGSSTVEWPTVSAFHYANIPLATEVFAVFAVAFGATYVLAVFARSRPSQPWLSGQTPNNLVTAPTFRSGAFGIALILLAGRYLAGHYLHLGEPGVVPIALPFHSSGTIELATQYGPLAIAACLLWSNKLGGPLLTKRVYAVIILVLYALIGSLIGWRSYVLDAAILWFSTLSIAQPYLSNSRRRRTTRAIAIEIAAIAVLVFAGVTLALFVRPTQLSGHSSFSFLFNRIGGLDYLAPAVGVTRVFGFQPSLLDPNHWDEFLKVAVYGYPTDATTGVAGTGVGWLFASLGWFGVALGGVVFGVIGAVVDTHNARRASRPTIRSLYRVGVYLAWLDFMTEGTFLAALRILLTFIISLEVVRLTLYKPGALREASPAALDSNLSPLDGALSQRQPTRQSKNVY